METTSTQTSQQTHKRKRGETTPEPRTNTDVPKAPKRPVKKTRRVTHKRKREETTPEPRTNTDVPKAPKRPGKKTRRVPRLTLLHVALTGEIARINIMLAGSDTQGAPCPG